MESLGKVKKLGVGQEVREEEVREEKGQRQSYNCGGTCASAPLVFIFSNTYFALVSASSIVNWKCSAYGMKE